MRGVLPTQFPAAPGDPTASAVSPEEAYALALLRMDDKEWQHHEAMRAVERLGMTGRSGVAHIDAGIERRRKAREAREAQGASG